MSYTYVRGSALFLSFLTYSFLGWFYESTVWAVCEKKRFINRGYLIGPCCPIYGFVSLFDWYLLYEVENPVKIFIIASLVCCGIEYVTSVFLERTFHTRWWDYSNYPFNLNGRISLFSAVLFGFSGLALVKLVHPFVYGHISQIPVPWINYLAELLFIMFTGDILLTTMSLKHFSSRVETFYDTLSYCAEKPFDYLTEYTEPVRKKAEERLHAAAERFTK